ncbi:MAG TPA: undecaprenyl-diphosphatase [Rhodospirillaceae bacterium]|nr:undecaprenyl-diphosphatase [Candidatus Neomarinimicrobiota bacterium]HCX14421.1 undecaprenyl-diphosphatase [Rhodospirillaceae bacterium]
MDILNYLQAAFLGLVEGITEFLPVSSTGHLILLVDLLGFQGPPGALFEIVIQLGAILAVVWVYRTKIMSVFVGLPTESSARRFTLNIFLAFLPAVVIGALSYDLIKSVLFSPWVVSTMLIVGGIAIIIIEKLQRQEHYHLPEEIPPIKALAIGLFQCTAMIPGVSRSGATIMGALLVGVERRAAAEFSFLLAIPTILAATAYDLYRNYESLTTDSIMLIAVGFITAFIVAMLVVRGVLVFISRHGYVPFAIYRIIVGTIMLAILFLR